MNRRGFRREQQKGVCARLDIKIRNELSRIAGDQYRDFFADHPCNGVAGNGTSATGQDHGTKPMLGGLEESLGSVS